MTGLAVFTEQLKQLQAAYNLAGDKQVTSVEAIRRVVCDELDRRTAPTAISFWTPEEQTAIENCSASLGDWLSTQDCADAKAILLTSLQSFYEADPAVKPEG